MKKHKIKYSGDVPPKGCKQIQFLSDSETDDIAEVQEYCGSVGYEDHMEQYGEKYDRKEKMVLDSQQGKFDFYRTEISTGTIYFWNKDDVVKAKKLDMNTWK